MDRKNRISRRSFLTATASTLAMPYIVPSKVFGKEAPSNRVTLGIIGLGDRGNYHARSFSKIDNAEVLAVCDPFKSYGLNVQKTIHQWTGQKSCMAYQDFRHVLERKDIDAVVIASPENWHAVQTIMAAASGKDIYCEKAISLTVKEGIAMCDAVRRNGRILQVGTQQRSDSNFRLACELARNGYLGEIKEVRVGVPGGRALPNPVPKAPPADLDYDIWLGPAPKTPYNDLKCRFNWYFMSDYCAGWIQSWGVHHCDIALWGVPEFAEGKVTVEGTAEFPNDGMADTSISWQTKITSQSGKVFSFASNNTPGHGQGCRFIGDKGWVHVRRGGISAEPKSLLSVIAKPEERLYRSAHHQLNFLECVRTRRDPAAPIEAGHKATAISLIADIATRLERKLTWDWSKQQFEEDKAANRMLSRPMRAPWQI
ncbi:MAG: Gfo/Idh/MocA family oxidoreductase [Anaerohalosphaera sp.]|nr:Gfo/Idh/MocA family oxidoreductase [Anaerohalosphaera sp.]